MLMLGGIAIVGAATATIVSAMNERIGLAHQRAARAQHQHESAQSK
jgi:hypothetical protein